MSNEPVERELIERVRVRLDALAKANAAPRCGARSKRTGKPCRAAAMPNGRCKVHGGKSTGPRTPEGLERSRRANWKHGYYSREAKAERSRVRAAIIALRDLEAGDEPDHWHRRLLRTRRERPCCCRACEQRDELAALHSITSSASCWRLSGTSRPSALA